MHYYQFNIGDYRKDTIHLSRIEHSIYRDLIDWYYLEETPIPKETQVVIRRLRLGCESDILMLSNVLSDFFSLADDGYRHGRIDADIAEYHIQCDKNKKNGIKGGRPKAKKTQSVASGLPVAPQVDATANPNHKPLTTNHKPLTINQVDTAEPKGSRARFTKKCPADFIVTQEMSDWARTDCPLINMKLETDSFMDYTFSTAKTDWVGTWRNWMRKANKFSFEKQGSRGKSPKVYHTLINMNYEEGVAEDGSF